MSVKVQELTKIYGEQRAVDNISFEIKTGEIVGFLGPNGAGKSTTMKMLTCYILPSSGTATVCGLDVEKQSLEVRKKIGYLPEHNPLYTEMYIREYLTFIAGIHKYKGSVKARVEELIELTGLGVEKHKKIGALSKGYRQRVGLAQALLHDPEVLILDEPTSGLDPNQIVEIRNLIKDIGKSKTVILSTHIMQEVQAMCSRIIIINRGKIVADDSTEAISKGASGLISIKVYFKSPVTANELRTIKGVTEVNKKDNYWVLRMQEDNADAQEEIFRWAVANNNVVFEMAKEVESLESIFQTLTKNSL